MNGVDRVTLVAVFMLATASFSVDAAVAAPPGAGSLLQELKPIEPPPPSEQAPGLQIEPGRSSTLPESDPFLVSLLTIAGNTSIATSTLHALIADVEGKTLTLPALAAAVGRLTDYYHSRGYPLARAIIPPQNIHDGVVAVQIIEARYGSVLIDNTTRVRNSLLQATLAPLKSDQVISEAELDRTLLLLGDIPGIAPSATLKPGTAVGTADLLVQVAPVSPFAANLTLANDGNRYTGSTRGGAEAAIDDLLHSGDVLDASLLTSGKDMTYGRASYEFLLNGAGTRVGASYSALHYELGDSLESLEGHGTAEVDSVWAKQPLMRGRSVNLYGQLQFDHKALRDDLDVSDIHTHRHLDNGSATLSGDERDSLHLGGVTTWSLALTLGRVGFDDAAAQEADASTADIRGRFLQWNLSLARVQRLTSRDSLYVSIAGQLANANLDSSQKMVAGGPYTVRAYDLSAANGDTGIQSSIEWRHDLAWHRFGQFQPIVFLDTERVQIDRHPSTRGTNGATLDGVGVGVNWAGTHQWTARLAVATPFGATPELVHDNSSVHVWANISKGF